MLCPQTPQGVRSAKAADVTSDNAMHAEPKAARHAHQEASQREAALSSRLSLALAGERKAAAQSADLAAKLAHVQKQLKDAKNAMGEMVVAWEAESAKARTCNLVLDDTKFEVSELEDALRDILAGEGGLPRWRLERARVGGGTEGRFVSKGSREGRAYATASFYFAVERVLLYL